MPPPGWTVDEQLGSGRFVVLRAPPDELSAVAVEPTPATDNDTTASSSLDDVLFPDSGAAAGSSGGDSATNVDRTQVAIVCDVSTLRTTHGLPRRQYSLAAKGSRRTAPPFPERPTIPTSYQIAVSHPASALALAVGASTHARMLVIDSLVVHPSDISALDPSQEGQRAFKALYQGPAMHKREYMEATLNISSAVSPLAPHRQWREVPDSQFFSATSRFSRYGHLPMHTVSPAVYDAVAAYVHDGLRVTDAVAEFVDAYARCMQSDETALWAASVREHTRLGKWRVK